MIRQQFKRIVAIQVCRVHFLSTKCTYQNYSVRSVSIIKEKQFFRNKVNESTHHFYFFFPQTPCSSFPCQNNATCVPNYTKNQYHCNCRPGYGGFLCETGRMRYWQESKNIHTMTMRYIFSDNIHEKVTQFLLVKINAVFK